MVELAAGQALRIVTDRDSSDAANAIPVPHPQLRGDVRPGQRLLLDTVLIPDPAASPPATDEDGGD